MHDINSGVDVVNQNTLAGTNVDYTIQEDHNFEVRVLQSSTGSFNLTSLILNIVTYESDNVTGDENQKLAPFYIIDNFGGSYPDSEGVIAG